MPKGNPVRLDQELMSCAALKGQLQHRSVAEQIEYWADLGQLVSNIISLETILSIRAGLAKLNVEEVDAQAIDPDLVFGNLEASRQNGTLKTVVNKSSVRYQTSEKYPGLLEKIDESGRIVFGQFNNGEFIPR